MGKRWIAGVIGIGVLGAVAVAQQGETALVGKKAPAFEASTTAGKKVSLESLTQDGPVFLLFWKERCPHNPRASKLFNAMHKAYGEKSKLVGVVNAGGDRATSWQKEFGVEYPFIGDGEQAILKAFGLNKSIVTVMVGKDGTVAKTFPGYGANELAELNKAMAEAAGVAPIELDLGTAPKRLTYG